MKPKTIQHPVAAEQWRDRLRAFSMRIGFTLTLSRTMIEFLSATADDAWWDRGLYPNGTAYDNWLASSNSLIKRGLIERKPQEEIDGRKHVDTTRLQWAEVSCYRLTPAGLLVVDLLKMAGIFVEADAAISKKSRRA